MPGAIDVKLVEAKAERYFTGMNEGDAAAVVSGFAEDATYYGWESREDGLYRITRAPRDEIRDYFDRWIKSVPGGIHYEIVNTRRCGDAVVIDWRDVNPSGGYNNEGILVFEFDDKGEITHARPYCHIEPMINVGWKTD